MTYDAAKTWKRLSVLLHEVTPSAAVYLVGVPGAELGGKLDVHEGSPRYRVTIAAGDVTENNIVAILAHEAGHITQYEEALPVKTETDATRRGMEFAKKWGVLDEYLDVHERFHQPRD